VANTEHVHLLKQGVEVWNRWMEDHGDTEPDLSQMNLKGENLSCANFTGVDLSGAILTLANLDGVDFTLADLRGADFKVTSLNKVIFNGTLLGNTTVFVDVDLSNAIGLDNVMHFGPSSIGIDTIKKSRGKIPLVFLRGCGLSDWEIEQIKLYRSELSNEAINDVLYRVYDLRAGKSIKFHRCFISYSQQDEGFAQKLYNDLQNCGVRCWFAPEDMKGGRKLNEQIVDAIDLQDKLLLILSETSTKSDWVAYEIKKARVREKREDRQILFPMRLVEWEAIKNWEKFDADTVTDLAAEIRSYFIPDFSNWKDNDSYKKAFDRLLKDLKAE
jgi:hypothetical protein